MAKKAKKAAKKSGSKKGVVRFGKMEGSGIVQSSKAAPAMSKGKAKLVDLFSKGKKSKKG